MPGLVTADLHLSINPRDAYRFAAMQHLAELIEKHKAEWLLILGDLTEEKNYHPATLANDVVDLIFNLSCMCPVFILRGNHDYTDADCPYFFFVRHMERVKWINKPTLSQISKDMSCLFLPHTANYKRDWVNLPFAKGGWQGVNWVFAHNTFEGASTEHGHKLHGIPPTVFPDDVEVISGDIHTPQKIDCVTYVGSPYTVDFGDAFEPRVLLLTESKMQSIPMLGPQKRLVELDARGLQLWECDNLYKDDIVKVRYKLQPEELEFWPGIKDQIKSKLINNDCIPFLIQPVLNKTVVKKAQIASHHIKSDEQVVQDFGKRFKVPEPTLEAGLELMREA